MAYDGLSSTTGVTSSSGSVTDTYSYDVFGAIRSQTGTSAQPFRFTGERQDPDVNRQLYYLRARYYDPALGRFWSRDPVPGYVGVPQTHNPYAYVLNNPANLIDPYGLRGFRDFVDAVVPDPVEEFVTDTASDWIYDHRYDIGQTVAGIAISASCFGTIVVCGAAFIAYGTITYFKVSEADGRCEKIIAGTTGVLGGIPGSFPFGKYTGEVLAGLSGGIDGISCASTVYASDTDGGKKE